MNTEPAVAEQRVAPDDWPEAIAAWQGPQIVVGGPGTGKTEFLVRRAVHLIDTVGIDPGRILLLSFSRRGVADLRTRIRRSLDRSVGEINTGTFHSFSMRLLEQHAETAHGEAPQVLTGPEQVALVRSLLAAEQQEAWPAAFRPLLATTTFAGEVTDFVLRCKEQLLGPDRLAVAAEGRADWRGLAPFLARYDAALRETNRIDYSSLLAEAVALLGDADVAARVTAGFAAVLVDEYQDTTHAQARLLGELASDHHTITVAADPYQSIYSFRGADVANVADFPSTFRDANGEPARRVVLTNSFRVPAEILEAAVRVTAHDLPGEAGTVVPAPGTGRVETYHFEQQTEEAEWIASEVERIHLEDAVPYSSIGVFVRSKRRFIPELSRALERRKIPHDQPDSRLADQPAVRFVLDCVIAASGREGPAETNRALRRILLGPLFAVTLGRLNDAERFRLRQGCSWIDAVRRFIPDGESLAGLLEDPSWATARPATQGFWHVWSGLPQIGEVVADPARGNERAAWSSFAQVLSRWNERNPTATLDDYRMLTEQEEFEARPLLSYAVPDEDRLVLTTLHQSKGLEFEVVFIADAVEGVFPDLRSRDSLLGVRHLLPHVPVDTAEYIAFRLREERRLAYTAMSRARRRLVWTATSTGYDEGAGMPSRFLALVAGTATVAEAVGRPPRRDRPVTRREAEAYLRRIASDPAAPRPRRLAALEIIRRGPGWGLRSPTQFVGVRATGPDDGLVDPGLVMSPSQADAYKTCPLRYAYERRLRIGDETTLYAEFGLLIHKVLEITERSAVENGSRHGDLATALGVLGEEMEPAVFGGEPFATAWRRRAEATLTRLYERWPSRGVPVALEHRMRLELGDVEWTGIADRIEATDAGLKIVDYKTTRNPPTVKEIAGSLQLGFYMLAAAEDPDLAGYGTPAAAETWYPARELVRGLKTLSFDAAALPEVASALGETAAGILAEEWPAIPNANCERCRLRTVCPQWPEGREGFRP